MFEPLSYEIDITKHFPPTVSDFEEFIEIGKVENANFNRLRVELLQLFSTRFAHASDEVGIARWEKMLKLKPRATDDLEVRRMRVLAKINNKIPYTWRSLQQLLNSMLEKDGYALRLDSQTFDLFLDVYVSITDYKLLNRTLDNILPLNILYEIARVYFMPDLYLKTKHYSFGVPYPTTNTFQTANVPGKLANIPLLLAEDFYTFPVYAPICNTFVTSTISSSSSELNFELANEYRNVKVLYKRTSNKTITGEGEL